MLRLMLLPVVWFVSHGMSQEPAPATFSTSTRLVLRAVKVSDERGGALPGLTASDFHLTENGVPQRVVVCEYQAIAGRATDAQQAAALSEQLPEVQRKLVFFFDLDGIARQSLRRALAAASQFLNEQLSKTDSVAILASSRGNLRNIQDFTSDRDLLLAALARLGLSDREAAEEEIPTGFGANNGEFNVFATNRRLATLARAVRQLERNRQRKAIIYFSDGWSLGQGRNLADMRALVDAARRANVEFYPIDTRGLAVLTGMGDASMGSPGGVEAYSGSAVAALNEAFELSQDALYALAADTGGKAWLNNNNLAAGIEQAQRLYTSYYLIGYYSTNTATDGKYRRIAISLRDRGKVRLDYADGYYGEKVFQHMSASDRERHLEEAFLLESPLTDIPLAAAVNYFQMNSDEYYVPVVVNIAGAEVIADRHTGSQTGRAELNLIAEVKDSNGRTVKTLRDRVSFSLDAASRERLLSGLIEYDTGYTLLPGDYAIKVLVRDGETGRVGTLLQTFTVPNLNRAGSGLRRSSIVVGPGRTKMVAALFTAGRDKQQASNPLVREGRKLVPSVARTFGNGGQLVVFGEVYGLDEAAGSPITAYAALYRDAEKVFETAPSVFSPTTGRRLGAVPVEIAMPLEALPAGRYECQLTLLDRQRGDAAVWRDTVWVLR